MRAIVIEKFGGPENLVYKELPEPEPKAGYVVIEIKAFGINHAEMHMRRGEWAEAAKVSGIECVGLVKACPGGEFPIGAKVAALMGGLGRTINGSYAEYARAPASNVALIESDLPWAELAAIPETYATAWTCLFRNAEMESGRLLVIRGATSSLGQAALKMAVNVGVRVIATTRNRDRFSSLRSWEPSAAKSNVAIYRSTSRRRRRSMRCSTWWVTASCSTRLPCFAAGAVPVLPAGSAVSIQSPTSTRCCKWRAASI